MAKWGEGDPRWIVEERPDATNVNNWHWTEKNASEWSKEKMNLLFKGLKISKTNVGKVDITEVSKCEGDATVNNRKGKLIFFYEWVIELNWRGRLDSQPDEEITGQIEIPNISEENEPHEIDINVTLKSEGGSQLKDMLLQDGIKIIQTKVAEYIQALKDEYSSDVILPTRDSALSEKGKICVSQDLANNIKNIQVSLPDEAPKSDSTSKIMFRTSTMTFSHTFKCTAEELYNVFTIKEMVCAFTRSEVKLDAVKGGKFELLGGNISGEFVSLVPGETIVQKWRFKSWPPEHYSLVTITLRQATDSTIMDVKQIGIPSSDFERTKVGWQNYYIAAIKQTFGYGANLF